MILWAGEVESCSLRRRWKHLFTCGRGRWEHVAPRRVDNPTVGPLALAPSVAQPSRRGPQLPRSTPTPATGTGVDLCIARRPHMINRFISFVTGRAERAPEAQGEAEAMVSTSSCPCLRPAPRLGSVPPRVHPIGILDSIATHVDRRRAPTPTPRGPRSAPRPARHAASATRLRSSGR